MNVGQFTPALRCDEEIEPFRLVRINDRNEGSIADAVTDRVAGVTTGDNRRFDDTAHANVGESLRLQPGSVVQVEAGEAISVAALLRPGTSGLIYNVDTATDIACGEALEDAADANEVIRVFLRPELTTKS